jgi:hypothetical protein
MLWVHRCAVRVRSACQSAAKETNRTPGRVGPRHGLIPRGLRRLARSRDLDNCRRRASGTVFSGTRHVSHGGRRRWRPRQRPGLPCESRRARPRCLQAVPGLRRRKPGGGLYWRPWNAHDRREPCHVMSSASCQVAHRPAPRRNPSKSCTRDVHLLRLPGDPAVSVIERGRRARKGRVCVGPQRLATDTEAWVAWSGR